MLKDKVVKSKILNDLLAMVASSASRIGNRLSRGLMVHSLLILFIRSWIGHAADCSLLSAE